MEHLEFLIVSMTSMAFFSATQGLRPCPGSIQHRESQAVDFCLYISRPGSCTRKQATCGAPREHSTRMESTMTSEHTVSPLHRCAGSLAPSKFHGSSCKGVVLFHLPGVDCQKDGEPTCGAPRERSTTMESTTTSEQAVPRLPTTVASSAPAGDRTTVAIASHDSEPACDQSTQAYS